MIDCFYLSLTFYKQIQIDLQQMQITKISSVNLYIKAAQTMYHIQFTPAIWTQVMSCILKLPWPWHSRHWRTSAVMIKQTEEAVYIIKNVSAWRVETPSLKQRLFTISSGCQRTLETTKLVCKSSVEFSICTKTSETKPVNYHLSQIHPKTTENK